MFTFPSGNQYKLLLPDTNILSNICKNKNEKNFSTSDSKQRQKQSYELFFGAVTEDFCENVPRRRFSAAAFFARYSSKPPKKAAT